MNDEAHVKTQNEKRWRVKKIINKAKKCEAEEMYNIFPNL